MVSKKTKCLLVVFAYAAIIFTSVVSSVLVQEVSGQETQNAIIRFEPSDITVGELGQDLPSPLTTLNVTVINVTNLFAWQIKVYYDPSILSFEGEDPAVDPPANINIFGSLSHFFYNITLQDDGGRYVLVAGTLLPKMQGQEVIYPSVNGSGVLTQLRFRGVSTGSSYLNFSRPYGGDTTLLNVTEVDSRTPIPIPADLFDLKVTVLGYGLSLLVQPNLLEIGQETNITGSIYPRPEISADSVVIYYLLNGTTEEKTLATVDTVRIDDVNGTYYTYIYPWTPDREGLFFVRAEGGGFASQEVTLRVSPSSVPPPPNLWLLYGPYALVAGAVVGGFFVWDRRRRHSNRLILP